MNLGGLYSLISKNQRRIGLISLSVIALLFATIAVASSSRYRFDSSHQSHANYNQVLVGTSESMMMAKEIKDRMIASGIEPIEGKDYIFDYDLYSTELILHKTLKIGTKVDYSDGSVYDTRKNGFIRYSGLQCV